MAKFSKGEHVRLITAVPEGPVARMRMDDDGNVQYLITWVDLRGEEQHKWFDEAELEPAAGAST